MSDVDRAVPVVPEKSPAAPRRRPRFRLPGWTMLVVLVAAIGAFAYFSSADAVPVEPVDVTSWVCPEEVEEKQQWQYYLDAGCREEPVDTTITLMHLAGELDTRTTASGTAHFDRVAVKSIELAFRIDTAEPRQAVILFDLAEDPRSTSTRSPRTGPGSGGPARSGPRATSSSRCCTAPSSSPDPPRGTAYPAWLGAGGASGSSKATSST